MRDLDDADDDVVGHERALVHELQRDAPLLMSFRGSWRGQFWPGCLFPYGVAS